MKSRNHQLLSIVAGGLLLAAAQSAPAQIVVGNGSGHNQMGVGSSVSGDMSGTGDLLLINDLELGGELYLDGRLYMERDLTSPAEGDQWIFFADGGDQDNEYIGWDESRDGFLITNDLVVNGAFGTFNGFTARFRSITEKMTFLIDSNAAIDAASFPHQFTWYNNFELDNSRAMQLTSVPGSVGDLELAGSLTQNGFDLAELFLTAAPLVAGELAAVDSSRPDAVRPAVAGDAGRILGIVATDPGIILGGGGFSVEALRDRWGDAVASEFDGRRPAIATALYAERPGLRQEADRLASIGAWGAYLSSRAGDGAEPPSAEPKGEGRAAPAVAPALSPGELQEQYEQALLQHEMTLFDLSLARFLDERFVRVALAGRVPVKVDASFGAIEIGDPLTASPVAGVAMKAQNAGMVVGTALEAFASGSGTILAFVDRDWLAPGAGPGAGAGQRLAELERQVAELRRALESRSPEPPRPMLSAHRRPAAAAPGSGPSR